jgi:hypothetical protein
MQGFLGQGQLLIVKKIKHFLPILVKIIRDQLRKTTLLITDSKNPNYRVDSKFFTDQELSAIKEDILSKTEEDWGLDFKLNYQKQDDVSANAWEAIKGWDGMSIVLSPEDSLYGQAVKKAKLQVEERFGVIVSLEQFTLNRWRVGRQQEAHIDYFLDEEDNNENIVEMYTNPDSSYFDYFKKYFKTKNFSTIIYINDDFVGGELFFPQYNDLEIKPSENSAISFKGDTNHLHGVKIVEEGIRYTISIFWTEI